MSLTDDPNSPCLKEIKADGQQQCYLVLSEEERAKGFVRAVRQVYRHEKCGTTTHMGTALAETYARDPAFYGGTFCVHCGSHFRLVGEDGTRQFAWIGKDGKPDGSFVGE